MRSLLILAALMIACAMIVGRSAEKIALSHAPAAMTSAPEPAAAGYGTVELSPDRQGHFHADIRVDARRLQFLIDTGATTVVLKASDAAQLGIHPAARDFSIRARTANGVVAAAPVRLGMVELDGILIRDVAALVLPDEGLSENLLGMSFLSRLRRYEYAQGKLVLEQ